MERPSALRRCWPVAAVCLFAAWSGYDVAQDGMRVRISNVGVVTNPAAPVAVTVTISNGRTAAWSGEMRIEGLVDDWKLAGPAAARCYWGLGYVVAKLQPFTVYAGSHTLDTTHVGFEFADGPAVVQTVDVPPNSIVVHPDRRVFSIESDNDTTLTSIPLRGVLWTDQRVHDRPQLATLGL